MTQRQSTPADSDRTVTTRSRASFPATSSSRSATTRSSTVSLDTSSSRKEVSCPTSTRNCCRPRRPRSRRARAVRRARRRRTFKRVTGERNRFSFCCYHHLDAGMPLALCHFDFLALQPHVVSPFRLVIIVGVALPHDLKPSCYRRPTLPYPHASVLTSLPLFASVCLS